MHTRHASARHYEASVGFEVKQLGIYPQIPEPPGIYPQIPTEPLSGKPGIYPQIPDTSAGCALQKNKLALRRCQELADKFRAAWLITTDTVTVYTQAAIIAPVAFMMRCGAMIYFIAAL